MLSFRIMTDSPTKRSLKYLKDMGYVAGVTEKWNQFARIRQDLWGFVDIMAFNVNAHEILAVQTTTYSNFHARIKKILGNESARGFIEAGGEIVVHGWKLVGARGTRKTWQVTAKIITLSMFTENSADMTQVKTSEPTLE